MPYLPLVMGAVKYGLIAAITAGLTWFGVSTIKRAQEATYLEAKLKAAQEAAEALAQFNVKVDGVRTEFATRFDEFSERLETIGDQRRERIIERLPANTRTCLDSVTVRLLNSGDAGEGGLPATTGKPDDARPPITATAGSGFGRPGHGLDN